ncbi:MAG: hypothetical protein ACI9S8_000155 [Chlamydiales bacterium]|jgi:hypothetical protein
MSSKNEKIPRLAIRPLTRGCDIGSFRHEIFLQMQNLLEEYRCSSNTLSQDSSDKLNFKKSLTDIGADKHSFLNTLFSNLVSGKEALLKSAEEEAKPTTKLQEKELTHLPSLSQKLENAMSINPKSEKTKNIFEKAEAVNSTMDHIIEGGSNETDYEHEKQLNAEKVMETLAKVFSGKPEEDELGLISLLRDQLDPSFEETISQVLKEVETELFTEGELEQIIDSSIEEALKKTDTTLELEDEYDEAMVLDANSDISELFSKEIEKAVIDEMEVVKKEFKNLSKTLKLEDFNEVIKSPDDIKDLAESHTKAFISNFGNSKEMPGPQFLANILESSLFPSDDENETSEELDVYKKVDKKIESLNESADLFLEVLSKKDSDTPPSKESIHEAVQSLESINKNINFFEDIHNIDILKNSGSNNEIDELITSFSPIFSSLGLEINSLDDVMHSYEDMIHSFLESKDQMSLDNQNMFAQAINDTGAEGEHIIQALESLEKTFHNKRHIPSQSENSDDLSKNQSAEEQETDLMRIVRDLQDKKKAMFYIELHKIHLSQKDQLLKALRSTELGGIREQAHYLLFLRRLDYFMRKNHKHCPITQEESVSLQIALEMNCDLPIYFRVENI